VTIGSEDIFFSIISTFGPPGFTGGKGPIKETTSSGCWLVRVVEKVVAGLVVEEDVICAGKQAVRRMINIKAAHNNGTL
jgi:hypothetical protein